VNITNSYNARGLPYTVSGSVAGNLVTSTLYNQLGAITEINLGNGVKTTYGYYGTGGAYDTTGGYYGRLWEIKSVSTSPDPDETRQDVVYTWDANGNMLSRVDNVPVTPVTEEFEYDSLDRLIEVSNAYSRTFGYDTIGNLTDNNGVTQTYGNNAGPHAITYDGTNSYTYDANGNMNVGTARSWDVENRLTSVTKNSVTETYVYDGDGNKVA